MSRLEDARRALDDGDLERAEALASAAIRDDASPAALGVYGDVVGRLRNRAEAEEWLTMALEQHPRSASLHALRGEQRIRQGRWGDGTEDFVAALELDDPDGLAEAHTHRVLDELVDAVRAGKVPEAGANRFINRLDYSTSKSAELAAIFGSARRALKHGTTLAEQGAPAPAARARALPEPPRRGGDVAPPEAPLRRPTRPSSPPPSARPTPALEARREGTTMAASQARLDALIRHDRALNERLQESIEHLGVPVWPSENAGRHLDPLPPLRPEGIGRSLERLEHSSMALTTGSIDTEILLERCLSELLLAAHQGTALAPTLDRPGLTRLELAQLSGAMGNLSPLLHRDEVQAPERVAWYGLGAFLGDCLVRGYGGTWTFDDEPAASRVRVGERDFDPLAVARAWIDAADKDDVALEEPLAAADQIAAKDARLQTPRVDPTAELTKQALAMKLAEAWAANYPLPKDVPLVDVAASITPLDVGGRTIVFAVDPDRAPPAAITGPDAERRAHIAYLRRTGECLVLASRRHFARFLAERFDALTRESAADILQLYAAHHRPGVGMPQNPRMLELRDGGRALMAARWQLIYQPHHALTWQLTERAAEKESSSPSAAPL